MALEIKWEILKIDYENVESLVEHLSTGWEPFAVTTLGGTSWTKEYIWVRRSG